MLLNDNVVQAIGFTSAAIILGVTYYCALVAMTSDSSNTVKYKDPASDVRTVMALERLAKAEESQAKSLEQISYVLNYELHSKRPMTVWDVINDMKIESKHQTDVLKFQTAVIDTNSKCKNKRD